jgi:hypothetical protein
MASLLGRIGDAAPQRRPRLDNRDRQGLAISARARTAPENPPPMMAILRGGMDLLMLCSSSPCTWPSPEATPHMLSAHRNLYYIKIID